MGGAGRKRTISASMVCADTSRPWDTAPKHWMMVGEYDYVPQDDLQILGFERIERLDRSDHSALEIGMRVNRFVDFGD
jgi:hypothetical protein